MELPPPLRRAVDAALEGTPLPELARAAEALSRRYRAERRDGGLHLADEPAVKAYLATRLPATYAAVRASLGAVAEARPELAPASLLDLGAGPGTGLWAAADCWPGLAEALLVEASPAMRAWGERLAAEAPVARIAWRASDLLDGLPGAEPRDLVILAYVLDELAPEALVPLIDRLWTPSARLLVIVEPGTPAGWRRILAARERLLRRGARIAAPCPHAAACPLRAPDWCHFSRRLPRSRLHRLAKAGAVPWEDEKFIYLAAAREAAPLPAARVIARPRLHKGHVELRLCRADGGIEERLFSRRDGAAYKLARRLDWGDALPPPGGGQVAVEPP